MPQCLCGRLAVGGAMKGTALTGGGGVGAAIAPPIGGARLSWESSMHHVQEWRRLCRYARAQNGSQEMCDGIPVFWSHSNSLRRPFNEELGTQPCSMYFLFPPNAPDPMHIVQVSLSASAPGSLLLACVCVCLWRPHCHALSCSWPPLSEFKETSL